MNISDATFDMVAGCTTVLEPKSLNKNDVLDAIYTDLNIFSSKHPSMQGYSTPKSYANNMLADMAGYKRTISEDGCFYINQCGRALAVTRVADTKINVSDSPCKVITDELQILESEARKIAAKYYKDRLVVFYRIVPMAQPSSGGRVKSEHHAALPPEHTSASSIVPMILFFPLHSITDLLYPLDLELGNADDRVAARKDTVLNSQNYVGLNFNAAFVNAWITLSYPDSDQTLTSMQYGDSRHPINKLVFLEKTIMSEWLAGGQYSLVKYLANKPEEFLSSTHKIFRGFESYGDTTHTYTPASLREDINRIRGIQDRGYGGSVILDGCKEAIVSLWDISFNGTSVYETVAKYDHVKRKDNSMGLCDECPYKLLCLLGEANATNIPENANVCRSIAIVKGLYEAEMALGKPLLHTRKALVTLPLPDGRRVLTRKGLNIVCNYALDTAMESSPEDWLTANAALGLVSAAGRDDYMRERLAVRSSLEGGDSIPGVNLIEGVLSDIGVLDKPVKKYDLSHVRPSNNSLAPELRTVYEFSSSLEIPSLTKRMLGNILGNQPKARLIGGGAAFTKRGEEMLEFLIKKPVAYLLDKSALSKDTSLLEDYTLAGKIQEDMIAAGLFLKLNSKMISNLPAMKADLFSMSLAALSRNTFEDMSIMGKASGEGWWPKALTFLRDCAANNRDAIAAANKIVAWYNSVPDQAIRRTIPHEKILAKSLSLLMEVATLAKILTDTLVLKESPAANDVAGYPTDFIRGTNLPGLPSVLVAEKDTPESGRLCTILKEFPTHKYMPSSELWHRGNLIDIALIMALTAPELTVREIKDILLFALVLLSYSDCSVVTLLDEELSNDIYIKDEFPTHRSDLVCEVDRKIEEVFRQREGKFTTTVTGSDGAAEFSHGHTTKYPSVPIEVEAYDTLKYVWREGLNTSPSTVLTSTETYVFSSVIAAILKTYSCHHTGGKAFTEFVSTIDDRLGRMATNFHLRRYAVDLPVHVDIVANDHEGGVAGCLYKKQYMPGYGASRVLPHNNHGVRGLRYSATDQAALDGVNSYKNKDTECRNMLGTQITPHITLSNDQRSSAFSVADVLIAHYPDEILAFQDVKRAALPPDICLEHLHDKSRAKHSHVLELDYSQITDIRMQCSDTLHKVDCRMTAEGRTPPDLEMRPYGTLTHYWQNINGHTGNVADLVAAELVRHKQLIVEIVQKEGLLLFPDYDYDLTVIDSDIARKSRNTIRYQLRDVFPKVADDYIAAAKTRRAAAVREMILASYGQGSGLMLKRHESFDQERTNSVEYSLPALHEAAGISDRPKVLLYQRGVLKDVFVEYVSDGKIGIYWTLHGLQNLDMAIKKYHSGTPSPTRELSAEYRSDTVWITKKSENKWCIRNLPFAINEEIVTNDLPAIIRQVITSAMYYTYRGLLDSNYSACNLLLNIKRPVAIPVMLRTDPWYKYISRTETLGAYCVTGASICEINSEIAPAHESERIVAAECTDYDNAYNRRNTHRLSGHSRSTNFSAPLLPERALATRALLRNGAYAHPYLARSGYAPFNNPISAAEKAAVYNSSTALLTRNGEGIFSVKDMLSAMAKIRRCIGAFEKMLQATSNMNDFTAIGGMGMFSKMERITAAWLNRRDGYEATQIGDLTDPSVSRVETAREILTSALYTSSTNIGLVESANSEMHLIIQARVGPSHTKYPELSYLLNTHEWVLYREDTIDTNDSNNSVAVITTLQNKTAESCPVVVCESDSMGSFLIGDVASPMLANTIAVLNSYPQDTLHKIIEACWPSFDTGLLGNAFILAALRSWLTCIKNHLTATYDKMKNTLSQPRLQMYTGDAALSKIMRFKCDAKYVTISNTAAFSRAIDSLSEIEI